MEKGHVIPCLGAGYVRYVDHFGTDTRIVEAARISYKSPSKGPEADKKLLFYLYKQRHTSPFEQCNITFNIRMPIFVMRQFVRHRTFRLNEVSARYTELPRDFYTPEKWRGQDTKNRQGSSVGTLEEGTELQLDQMLGEVYRKAYSTYELMIQLGIAKELARIVLPVGIFTEIYVNCDLHNLMHFLRLRLDPHAQYEIRVVAQAMHDITAELFPWTMEAFRRFQWKLEDLEDATT